MINVIKLYKQHSNVNYDFLLQPQQRPQQEHRFTSKVRELVSGQLKEKWAATCREGASKLYSNGVLDSNVGVPSQRVEESTFESNLEDFYGICDQIEANLKCALEVCILIIRYAIWGS